MRTILPGLVSIVLHTLSGSAKQPGKNGRLTHKGAPQNPLKRSPSVQKEIDTHYAVCFFQPYRISMFSLFSTFFITFFVSKMAFACS